MTTLSSEFVILKFSHLRHFEEHNSDKIADTLLKAIDNFKDTHKDIIYAGTQEFLTSDLKLKDLRGKILLVFDTIELTEFNFHKHVKYYCDDAESRTPCKGHMSYFDYDLVKNMSDGTIKEFYQTNGLNVYDLYSHTMYYESMLEDQRGKLSSLGGMGQSYLFLLSLTLTESIKDLNIRNLATLVIGGLPSILSELYFEDPNKMPNIVYQDFINPYSSMISIYYNYLRLIPNWSGLNTQAIPDGDYKNSCNNIYYDNGNLSAMCTYNAREYYSQVLIRDVKNTSCINRNGYLYCDYIDPDEQYLYTTAAYLTNRCKLKDKSIYDCINVLALNGAQGLSIFDYDYVRSRYSYTVSGSDNAIVKCLVDTNGNFNNCITFKFSDIKSPTSVKSLRLNQNGNSYAYITNSETSMVTKCSIDNSNGSLSNCVNSGATNLKQPKDIVFNNSGTFAYIVNFGANTVDVCNVDRSNGNLSGCTNTKATTLDDPMKLVFNNSGTYAYITNYSMKGPNSNKVTRCTVGDKDGKFSQCSTQNIKGLSFLTGISLDKSGRYAYISSAFDRKIAICMILDNGKFEDNCSIIDLSSDLFYIITSLNIFTKHKF